MRELVVSPKSILNDAKFCVDYGVHFNTPSVGSDKSSRLKAGVLTLFETNKKRPLPISQEWPFQRQQQKNQITLKTPAQSSPQPPVQQRQ